MLLMPGIQEKRVDWQPNAVDWPFPALKPGEYGKDEDGLWYCIPPVESCGEGGQRHGVLGNLGNHKVIEHEDGTISVSPSILVSNGQGWSWHGYLERGVWRQC
ncbi:MAG TPA: hypothetical protein VHW09_26725 [Bryobacteraceae bacterium]|nr:hypothetical protein [Bryobacteraceae bacterium]